MTASPTATRNAAVAARSAVAPTSPRAAWIDNVRVAVIAGVIGAHVSIIYALDVGWYFEERTASTAAKVLLAAIFTPGLLFGMGLLFFVAGLFTPSAFTRKGAGRFVTERVWRLGAPTIAYLFVVNPAMNAFGSWASGEGEGIGDYFRRTYSDDVELGIAWFIAALLALSLAYAGWRTWRPARAGTDAPLKHWHLIAAAAFIAVASFAVRLELPFLATGEVWGLNLFEYPQMITLFALGALAAERHWLVDGLSPELRRVCRRAAAAGLALAAILGVSITLNQDPDPFLGGFNLEAAIIPVIEATLTLGLSLWTLDWFRRRRNRTSSFVETLGRGSFMAYLVHAPITVAVAVALRDVPVPAEAKFVVVFAVTLGVSFGRGGSAQPLPAGWRISVWLRGALARLSVTERTVLRCRNDARASAVPAAGPPRHDHLLAGAGYRGGRRRGHAGTAQPERRGARCGAVRDGRHRHGCGHDEQPRRRAGVRLDRGSPQVSPRRHGRPTDRRSLRRQRRSAVVQLEGRVFDDARELIATASGSFAVIAAPQEG